MSNKEILQALVPLIAEAADTDVGDIKADGRLRGYGIDSVRVVELMLSIEETFGVKIASTDLAAVHTVKDLAAYIEKKKRG